MGLNTARWGMFTSKTLRERTCASSRAPALCPTWMLCSCESGKQKRRVRVGRKTLFFLPPRRRGKELKTPPFFDSIFFSILKPYFSLYLYFFSLLSLSLKARLEIRTISLSVVKRSFLYAKHKRVKCFSVSAAKI